MSAPERKKKYNASEKGKKARSEYNKRNREKLEAKAVDRHGTCFYCGKERWLARVNPATCYACKKKNQEAEK